MIPGKVNFKKLLTYFKILSERMNVLTIYLPWGKLPVASNLRVQLYRENSCIYI